MQTRLMARPITAAALVLCAGLTAAHAADPPELGWKSAAELSYVRTGGNQQSSTLGFKGESSRTWASAKLTFRALAINSKVTDFSRYAVGTEDNYVLVEDESTRTSAERYSLDGAYQRDLSPRLFWMVSGGWERNKPNGVDNRYWAAAGLGNKWYDTDTLKWMTNYQVSATREEFVLGDTKNFLGLRVGSDLLWKFSPNAEYRNITILDENLDETDDWRVEFMNSVSVTMTKHLSLKAGLTIYYDNQPALLPVTLLDESGVPVPGAAPVPFELDEWDSIFTTSLVIGF